MIHGDVVTKLMALSLAASVLVACSDPADLEMHPPSVDLVPFEDGKGDGFYFDAEHILDDDLLLDWKYLSVEQVQDFLENTPYRRRSFLADYQEQGVRLSERIIAASEYYKINPLVLLVKLQVETSLVFQSEPVQGHRLQHAMGCGCPDNDVTCSRAPKGLFVQVDCAARLFSEYMEQMERNGRTLTGWGVGIAKTTSEGDVITPRTRATAALYTYTPWVLPGRGGNWLFWNVMRRFSFGVLNGTTNYRWIGGRCASDDECGFRDGFCLFTDTSASDSLGVCTRGCDTTCPDSLQPDTTTTACVSAEAFGAPADVTTTGNLCAAACRTVRSAASERRCGSASTSCRGLSRLAGAGALTDVCAASVTDEGERSGADEGADEATDGGDTPEPGEMTPDGEDP